MNTLFHSDKMHKNEFKSLIKLALLESKALKWILIT